MPLFRRRDVPGSPYPEWVSYEPALLPPVEAIRQEAVPCLEEWLRWGEEWSMLLRLFGRMTRRSRVLEIGCGVGRIAFALRYLLDEGGYDGFDVSRAKIGYMAERFTPAHPNFRFYYADIRNTYYNPAGAIAAEAFVFPYESETFDLVFAASVFTHMAPENTRRYLAEAGRVLRPGGRLVASCFLLDFFRPGRPRPPFFARPEFDFVHPWRDWGEGFRIGDPANPELMTAYHGDLLARFAAESGLRPAEPPRAGMWSGTADGWLLPQDLVVFERIGES